MKLRTGENAEETINVWTSLNDITVCLLFVLLLFISIYIYENSPKKGEFFLPTPTPTLKPTPIYTPTPKPTPFGKKLEWNEYSGEGKKVMLFDFNSAELTEEFKQALRKSYSKIYKIYSHSKSKCYIQVEGHTDYIGDEATNWTLGSARSLSVILYLANLKPQIPLNRYIVVSKGKMEPATSDTSDAGRSKNRRIVIKFVMSEK
mgnify:FL=1